jgi:diadenosine tetraphosphate (Ap4A) HIT family hydrolase
MSEFAVDPRITELTSFVTDWPLCRVFLMEDSRYFWLTLVPRLPGAVEITDLSVADRTQLMEEAARAGQVIAADAQVKKLNVGTLGNMVPQLHVHVIGRFPGDPAWPGPVWGHSPGVPYTGAARSARQALVSSR